MKSSLLAGSLCLLISCCVRYTPPPLEKTLSSHMAKKASSPGISYDAAERRYLNDPAALHATTRWDLGPMMPFLKRAEWKPGSPSPFVWKVWDHFLLSNGTQLALKADHFRILGVKGSYDLRPEDAAAYERARKKLGLSYRTPGTE